MRRPPSTPGKPPVPIHFTVFPRTFLPGTPEAASAPGWKTCSQVYPQAFPQSSGKYPHDFQALSHHSHQIPHLEQIRWYAAGVPASHFPHPRALSSSGSSTAAHGAARRCG
ncbi:hypothetical protein AvCA_07720 [Azotobacter vinelandii CA]|uniref:Uncharacterized protein n=2 Tax=Azotobacter vinelandii TaxID=354 RepID=C1DLS0_AZOVD|nr:hypothetical protein Avin_07720 [Azotobacter vinelandii DJ]AGK17195.1 hypothetical protein AvCA_07720 [Azotobacter vinelandii CA]AGK19506.1 hypothetical protein AvCA6_07720 [Azotobacter vinelandii CA6]